MNERTPLRKKGSGHGYFLLTSTRTTEISREDDASTTVSGGGGLADRSVGEEELYTVKSVRSGNTDGGEERPRFQKKPSRRLVTESRIVPDPQLQLKINPAMCLVTNTEKDLARRIELARRKGDVTIVVYAFTLVNREFRHVADCGKFEAREEYRSLSACYEAEVEAVNENQLCAFMYYNQGHYEIVAAIMLYLRTNPGGPLHTLMLRQPYRAPNCSASRWDRFWQPTLRGQYFKLIVDFTQSRYLL
jgi:hypothetical protein